MKTSIVLLCCVIVFVTSQIPQWVTVQRTPTQQNFNSKRVGCKSILPGYYKNIECLSNYMEEQLKLKATPHFALAETYRMGWDYQMPSNPDGSWGTLGAYNQALRADVYDNAVALILLTHAGKMEAAKQIADTLVLLTELDTVGDGRSRAIYTYTNPIDRDYVAGQTNTLGASVIDNTVTTGNMAWIILALTRFYHHTQDYKYLRTAIKIGTCINTNFQYNSTWGGYTGGFFYNINGQDIPVNWRSIDHNIAVFSAARMLFGLTGDNTWQIMMSRAQSYVQQLYNKDRGLYYVGSPPISPPQDLVSTDMAVPAEGQSWNVLADVDSDLDRQKASMRYMLQTMFKTEFQMDDITHKSVQYNGVAFSDQGNYMQFEETAIAAMALHKSGKLLKGKDDTASPRFLKTAQDLVQSLVDNQQYGVNGDGQGIVASVNPNGAKVWNGNDFKGTSWTYFPILHTASSAWAGLAMYYVMYDDEYANPFSEYYKKVVPRYTGLVSGMADATQPETLVSAYPSLTTVVGNTSTVGNVAIILTCIVGILSLLLLVGMALLNVRLIKKNKEIREGTDRLARNVNYMLSPVDKRILSPTPGTPVE